MVNQPQSPLVKINVRLPLSLVADLARAREKFGVSFSEIARMSVRRYNRLKPSLDAQKQHGPCGDPVTLFLASDAPCDASSVAAILRWYLSQYDLTPCAPCAPTLDPYPGEVIICDPEEE